MRFKQHIDEVVIIKDILDEHKDKLAKDCRPFLNDLKKVIDKETNFLYRGMGIQGKDFIKKKVRKDRRPLDSPERWHNDLGAGLKRKFGVDARSAGLFCNLYESHQFGVPRLIFPIGKYYCIWSDDVDDATEWEPEEIYAWGPDGPEKDKAIYNHVEKLMKTYRKGNLIQCIKGIWNSRSKLRTEVTVICDQYYVAHISQKQSIERWLRMEY